MNKSFLITVLTLLWLVNPVKVSSGTLLSTGAQQEEWTVRFDVKDSENEPLDNGYDTYIYNEQSYTVGYVSSYNPETKLPNGNYTYIMYVNYFCQKTGSFTVKDSDQKITTVFSKVRFHFSGQEDIEKYLKIRIYTNQPYDYYMIYANDAGYASAYLLPGTYTYTATQMVDMATGQFQVSENQTLDITKEITGFRAYKFFLETSTGKPVTYASVSVYNTDGSYIAHIAGINTGIYTFYLQDNKTYTYSVNESSSYNRIDSRTFTVNAQNNSTTILFYPVTFRLWNADGTKAEDVPYIFRFNDYNAYVNETDENGDAVFDFLPGHYTYEAIRRSHPAVKGSFDVDSSPLFVDHTCQQTHEARFLFQDSEEKLMSGAVYISELGLEVSENNKPVTIHLPDGNYSYAARTWFYGTELRDNLTIAGKDTTIVIGHKKLTLTISDNQNTPVDGYLYLQQENGYYSIYLTNVSPGVYQTELIPGNYRLQMYDNSYYRTILRDFPIVMEDTNKTINIVLNKVQLDIKTAGGENINGSAYFEIRNEKGEYVFYGSTPGSTYLPDGHYTYIASLNYIHTEGSFDINHEDKEITLFVYPVTFKVMLSSQLPVFNYNLYLNGSSVQLDRIDEYSAECLMLQGDFEYEVTTNSLQGNYIRNSGKIKVTDAPLEVAVIFYAVEFSITGDGKPVAGSTASLQRESNDGYYDYYHFTTNKDGKIKDYLSNGSYRYSVSPPGTGFEASGSFLLNTQNVNVNADFYTAVFRKHSPDPLLIFVTQEDSGNTSMLYNNDSIIYLTPGHYSYKVLSYYYQELTKGEFDIKDAPVVIDIKYLGMPTIGNDEFRIYPNPAKDVIWFDSPVDGEISITGMDGKVVLRQTLHQQRNLDISQLKGGTYIVRIDNTWNQTTVIRKLLVK